MRTVDADALEKEGWSLHRTIQVDKYTSEYQTKPLRQVPTIEPRCETCEAFNKTRLLIPQPQRTGRWIHQAKFGRIECDQCGKVYRNAFAPKNYCPNCGARMEGD